MTAAVDFDNVDVVFGTPAQRKAALPLLDAGAGRADILAQSGAVVACAGCTLSVAKGEISVLMGLSGSGKSTLLRTVNGLTQATRGDVVIRDGDWNANAARCSRKDLMRIRREHVAMVFQQFALLPWRTVEDNVGFGLELAGLNAAERKERVAQQLELVGLSQWAGRYAHELSGGMQQRVGLARAFATDAPILLMDEPFSALDPLIRSRLQEELRGLQERLKKTIIFVSHDLDEALRLGDTISIMEDGRIVQTGAPEDIILRPADEYVGRFIANVNPLSVLTAWNVMRDRRDLPSAGQDWVWLDRRHTTRFRLDENYLVVDAESNGAPAIWVSCDNLEILPEDKPQVFWARPETPLKTVMRAMHQSHTAPVALFDDSSRFIGAIGIRDVLGAVLKR